METGLTERFRGTICPRYGPRLQSYSGYRLPQTDLKNDVSNFGGSYSLDHEHSRALAFADADGREYVQVHGRAPVGPRANLEVHCTYNLLGNCSYNPIISIG